LGCDQRESGRSNYGYIKELKMNYKIIYKGTAYPVTSDRPRQVHALIAERLPDLANARNYRYNVYAIAIPESGEIKFAVNVILRDTSTQLLLHEQVRSNSPAVGYTQVSPYFDKLEHALQAFEEISKQWMDVTGLDFSGRPILQKNSKPKVRKVSN
jgi:hypothetical protein